MFPELGEVDAGSSAKTHMMIYQQLINWDSTGYFSNRFQ
jgi:hypothetical protein